jgi:hypothetical protein
MGIIGNKTLLHKLPLTQVGGAFASDIATIPNWHCKENANKLVSIPEGYYAGGAWILPETSGDITVDGGVLGSHLFTVSNLAGGLNGESNIVGSGDITTAELNALGFLISSLSQSNDLTTSISGSVNVSVDLVGSGDLNGALGALVGIVADLNGQGELNADIAGAVQIIANLSASGDISGAIKATVDLISTLTGTSELTAVILGNWNMVSDLVSSSNLTADIVAKAFLEMNIYSANSLTLNNGAVVGSMSSNITSLSELSPESLASNVWSALASQYNQAGTMGEKMNGAGSAGNPWTEIIEGTFTAADVMRLLASVMAGKSTIVDNGNGTATVKFRDLNDTVDRVSSEMEGSERINVDLNL